jgi:multidrug efflux system outer membrane protein
MASEEWLGTWWVSLNDAELNHLIALALTHNHDVRIATANLQEARALRRLTQFDLAPTVRVSGAYDEGLNSKVAAPGLVRGDREYELYDAGLDAIWELDLFGGVRRSVQAANAQVTAFDASREDVLVSVIAEIARNYLELRGFENQLAVAQRNAHVQSETLKITVSLRDGGRGTDFDVSRSRSLLNLTLSTIPLLEGAIQKTRHRISVLAGEQPGSEADRSMVSTKSQFPRIPPLKLNDPEMLLRRRPDIRAAERLLAAATARIGVATADLFPRITFVGGIGLQADSFSGLGANGADRWNFGPRITWAALDLGRVRARIKAADHRAEASLAFYERTVLEALEETENALVDFQNEEIRRQYLEASAQASEQAAELAQQRYDGGSADFLSVLDAQRTLLEAQDRLATSQTRAATAYVAVYKALGGGIPARVSGQGSSDEISENVRH